MCYSDKKQMQRTEGGKHPSDEDGEAQKKKKTRSIVSVSMRVNNVDYSALRSKPAVFEAFAARVKKAVAASSGNPEVTADDVRLEISAGSVIVKADVRPPQGVDAAEISTALGSQQQVAAEVTTAVAQVPGISDIASGTPAAVVISPPTVIEEEQPAALTEKAESEHESRRQPVALIIGISLGVVLLCSAVLLVVAACWCCRSRNGGKKAGAQSTPNLESNPNISVNPALEMDTVDLKMVEP